MFFFGYFKDFVWMGYWVFWVVNEDIVIFGVGFGEYGYQDMDIVFYVILGVLKYVDFMGNILVIKIGEFQYMYVGCGVIYLELNVFDSEFVYFLQIWIILEGIGGDFIYFQIVVDFDQCWNSFVLFVGFEFREG